MKIALHLATGNLHKVREFDALARLYPVVASGAPPTEVAVAAPAVVPIVVEDTGTFVGNARKKARAWQATLPPAAWVLADDSGLEVDALDGGPGVESAYFAGPEGDWAANLQKLVRVMSAVPAERRQAHFHCVLLLLGPAGGEQVFEGRCDGQLASAPAGSSGFGYDPLFIPEGVGCTYAELGEREKNRLSHRAHAWRRLVAWLGMNIRA